MSKVNLRPRVDFNIAILAGIIEDGEMIIKLDILPLSDLWRLTDGKTIAALYLYEKFVEAGMLKVL